MDPGVPDRAAVASTARAPAVAAVAADHHRPGPRRLDRCPDSTRLLPFVAITTFGMDHRVVASTGLYDDRGPH
jgi:hypothetical protein